MATKFSDLNIQADNKTMYNCREISISDILNLEIEILSFIKVNTRYGENRYLIHCITEGEERKFFTSSKVIKETLDKIPEDKFPILTCIKSIKFGSKKSYIFT